MEGTYLESDWDAGLRYKSSTKCQSLISVKLNEPFLPICQNP